MITTSILQHLRALNSQNPVKDKRGKKEILTQPVQYQASVVIRNFKTGLDFYSRCVVVHGFVKINPEVLDLPPVVKCSSQILRAAFALNKKSTLKTQCYPSFPLSVSFGYCQTSQPITCSVDTAKPSGRNRVQGNKAMESVSVTRCLLLQGCLALQCQSEKCIHFTVWSKLLFIVTLFCRM